jgi:hypothetical protein
MKTETILLLPSRFMTRLDEPGCAIAVDPDLEHHDTGLWDALQPHLEPDGVARFDTEEAAIAAGALREKVIPYR